MAVDQTPNEDWWRRHLERTAELRRKYSILAMVQALDQARKAPKARGARVKPGLAGSVETLETALLASYHRLPKQILESLHGPSDDVASGRIGQAKKKRKTPEEEALEEYGLPASAADDAVDADRLAAVLALILLWRRRHEAIADDAIETAYGAGREQALSEQSLESAQPTTETVNLQATVLSRFQADLDRLQTGLTSGTPRSNGIEAIVTSGETLGQVALSLKNLFDEEQFRVEMFAEALIWVSFLTGYRAGAVEGTVEILAEGGEPFLFRWAGPEDEKVCDPCRDRFGPPFVAASIADLPEPSEVCRFGFSCRHWYEIAG